MTAALVVGYVASAFSIGAFIPQVWKLIKTRDTKALSTPTWVAEVITFALWTTYGVLLGQIPIIVTNAACGVMSIFILVMKVASRGTRDKIADAVDPAA